ncbi:unnamed protein product [Rotaria sp. Silwood2]|nr:unnamed protein product [Rotaria sp. Silwood2]
MHGIVMFQSEESVNDVMLRRYHQIDGKEVFIHRSVPNQGSLKDNKAIQQLIVSSPKNQSLVESDINSYFSKYGKICNISHMKNEDNTWVIRFDYYDSVDRVLLHSPHRIEGIDVNVKKDNRNYFRRSSPTPEPTPKIDKNNTEVGPKKSNLKQVTMNEQVSCLSLPAKKYLIHITNLPANIDVETLSQEFDWDIYDIVMDPSINDRALSTQCWLKNANDEREVDNFVQSRNGRSIRGSIIQCEKEEDEIEFCNKFQFGQCEKSSDECHWEHISCTAKGTCSLICPYGHSIGMKTVHDSPNTKSTDYRIKIAGFKTEVTPQNLNKRFGPNNYYVDRQHDRIGYVVKIKTMKYAKQLMTKWHNKNIDGQLIKCQLELNPIPLAHRQRSRSRPASIDGELKRNRARSRPRDACSVQSSQETSDLGDTDNNLSITFDNREMDRDRRIFRQAVNSITRTPSRTSLHHASSSESISTLVETKYELPSDVPVDEWEITRRALNSDGKVLLIRGKADRKRLAVIKIYPNQSSTDLYQEVTVMKDLKDVKGVSQLIEPENTSNNLTQRRVEKANLWMIMKRAPGYSLKEFIERRCQGVLEVSAAIQLSLNLVRILQQMHSRGIFHQNLSPENIMIEWDLKSTSINQAQLTLLNFSQTVIVSTRTDTTIVSSTRKWYHAPQTNVKRLSLTIDASGVCAILFWLLTQMDPRHEHDELPHQQARDKLNDIIKSAANSTSLEKQLKMYLMDTFDCAFGYPNHHPWTINDLECRLESIRQLLIPNVPELTTISAIVQELASISNSLPTPPITINDAQRDAFEKASKAFRQAKEHFLQDEQNQFEWSDGNCTWIYSPHSSVNECHNDDVLTYYSFRGRTTITYSVIITCLASSIEGLVMTLSISSNVNGKTIRMPIGQYSTAQDYATDAQENFRTELKNLLLAIYKERKPIEH